MTLKIKCENVWDHGLLEIREIDEWTQRRFTPFRRSTGSSSVPIVRRGGRSEEWITAVAPCSSKISDDCCRDCGNEQLVTLTMRSADCQLLAGAMPRFTFISLILIRHTSDWPAPRRHSLTHSRFPSLSRISSLRTTGPFPLFLLVTLKYFWDGTSRKLLSVIFVFPLWWWEEECRSQMWGGGYWLRTALTTTAVVQSVS